jgi:hypothetical protein
MKTQTLKKLAAALVSLFTVAMMTTACQKNNDSAPPPAPVPVAPTYPSNCPTCTGFIPGSAVYSGTITQNLMNITGSFQVMGNSTAGTGQGIVQGTLSFPQGLICANLPPGSYPLNMMQPGYLSGQATPPVFQGMVTIGNAQAMLMIMPVYQGTGLFALQFYNSYCQELDLNF